MKKNILAENMRRFGTKNLNESNLQEKMAYDAILDLLGNMADADEETVRLAVEDGKDPDGPGVEHYTVIMKNIIPMLQSIARDIDYNRYNYNPSNM